jgi:enterochelin esterase-like enzyme
MGSWSLVTGWLPAVVTCAGVVALAALLASRRRAFWIRLVPIVALAGAVLVILVEVLVDRVWKPFPDALPINNLVWSWIGLVGVGLAAVRLGRLRWWPRIGAVVAALAVLAAASTQINGYWGAYPSVRSVLDSFRSQPVGLPKGAASHRPTVTVPPGSTVQDVWRPPATMPAQGTVSKVEIPGTVSRFPARPGYVYLPPAYAVTPRPNLPVIVLVAGQPGSPDSWLTSGRLSVTMDAYAHAHHGLAPVVVIPDDLGATLSNPLCVDSPRGNAETYLARDVPAWITSHLQVAPGRESWFIGGLSQGGTCSLQLAVRAPEVYGGFLDISGQREPTLGGRQKTVDRVFGGNAAAYTRINPMDIMRSTRFEHTAGLLVAGTSDQVYLPQQRAVLGACLAAGMQASLVVLPGGHTWTVWREGLVRGLPWVGVRSKLSPT